MTKKYHKQNNNMFGKLKIFNKSWSDNFDTKSRNLIKNKFKNLVIDNPNIYGEDMVVVNTAYNAISTECSLEISTEDGLVITVES